MIEDPTLEEPPEFFVMIDKVFLILYSIEMFVKISGLGFIWAKGSYLRDYWNILDFVIVMSGYVTLYLEGMASGAATGHRKEIGENDGFGGGTDLTGLRVFRVLRPLKTI